MRGIYELLNAKFFNIQPSAAASYRRILESNLNGHIPFLGADKVIGRKISALNGAVIEDTRISTESGMEVNRYNDNLDDPFIDVLIIDGPMTRSGDICTYGSVDHRDMMMSAANNANCVGHLFIVNTPGGTAWTHNDYQQAIDFAHSKNQPVVMWIDGICMSAGMYLATMCDERWYMHPKDEVGCIGTMAMFYSMEDGQKNYNNETYHELYDPESFDKNKEVRDVNAGDDKMLVDELAKLGKEFREDCKKAFPKADDSMLHGAVYEAGKVKGVFLNGQTDFGGAMNRVIALAKTMGNVAAANVSSSSIGVSGQQTGAMATATTSKVNDMKKNYQNVAALLGAEELAVKTDGKTAVENGSFLNVEQLDALEQAVAGMKEKADKLDETQKALDEQKQINATLQESQKAREEDYARKSKELDDAKAAHEKALADAKAASDKALADAEEASDKALAEAKAATDKANADAKAAADKAAADLKAANERIAALEQEVKDANAKIEELGKASAPAAAQQSPANNGTGAQEAHLVASSYVFDPAKSYQENCRLEAKWKAEHGK